MDKRIILLAPADNCFVAAAQLDAGTQLDCDNHVLVLPGAVALGHKLARNALQAGAKVIKYGAVIGHVTCDVAAGAHLHTHNLESDYLPTYTHESGKAYVSRLP